MRRRDSRRHARRSSLLFEALEPRTLLANDLVGFAELLTLNDVKLYGAGWCPNCVEQKELFEDGAQFLTEVDLYNADGTRNNEGPNIQSIPTWEFPDGNGGTNQVVGKLTLDQISTESGIDIPQSDDPWMKPIGELLQVLSGSPLHVPLDGYDPNGDALTYEVTVADANGDPSSLVTAEVLEGNRSMRVNVVSHAGGRTMNMGEMVFELFEQRVPRPTDRLVDLTESGHFDDTYYHRLEPGFVLQGGGSTATQGGSSTLGDFDDQFHVDLQHNRDGILSYAKAGDDTNDAQYFVTLDPARFLDFNHSVAGQLVEGFDVLQKIESEPVVDQGGFNSPEFPKQVAVLSAFEGTKEPTEIFTDTENAVVMLKADTAAIGQEFTVTVTAKDTANNETTITFDVTVADDITANGGANGGPFLEDIGEVATTPGVSAEIQLSAIDAEDDPVFFDAVTTGTVNYELDVNNETGLVTATPPDGFVGQLEALVGVRAQNGSDTADTWDQQVVTIDVTLNAPSIELLPSSDSNVQGDNVTNIANPVIRVPDAASGATVEILDGDTVVGQGTANSIVDVTTSNLDDGVHTLTARQTLGGVQSATSTALQVTVDTVAPGAFTSTPPTTATAGVQVVYDAQNPEEGTSGIYSLTDAPDGVSIHADTGVVTWTPSQDQAGLNSFQIVATDLAGNETPQDVSIEVSVAKVQITLQTTDSEGTPIETIQVDSDYLLRVFVKDVRQPPLAEGGVFSSYVDIQYDASLVTTDAAGPDDMTFADEYTWLPSGDFGTPGVVADAGSAAAPDPDSPTLFPPFGPQNMLQFSIPMTATNEGEATFSATPSDDELLPIAVYANDGAVPPEEVVILGTSLVIGEGLIARDDIFNVDEDSSNNLLDVINNAQGADENPQGGAITITSVGATDNGGEVIISNNQVNYTPASDFFGEEKFTYTISNGQSTSTASVTVQVFPQNDAPTAVDDTFTVEQDSQGNFLGVLANDSIVPDQGESLSVSAAGSPSQGGTVTIAPGGTHLEYTPAPGFAGQETIGYTVSDGNGGSDEATVTVTVEEGTSPTAVDDQATVDEDSTATAIDVLSNDTAAEGGQLTVANVTQPITGGNVTIGTGGANVSYTPATDFFGTDTFTYTVAEAGGGQSTATVTVTINGQNDPPTANDDNLNVTKNSQDNSLNVQANDTDLPDAGETLTITDVTLVSADQGSTFSISGDGQSILYTPATDFTGSETVTYTINDRSDGSGLTAQATVTVNVAESTVSGRITATGGQTAVRDLELSLTSADGQGSSSSDSPQTDATGYFEFAATPGSYIVEADPPFLAPIEAEVEVASGENVVVNPSIVRESLYITIADFLSTAPGQSSLAPEHAILAAVTPGAAQHDWYSIEAGWEGYTDFTVKLSADGNTITLTATRPDGQPYEATIPADDAGVEFMGREDDARLVRITVEPSSDGCGTNACSLEGEGEATSATPAEIAAATPPIDVTPTIEQPTATPVTDIVAEGEAVVAPPSPITIVPVSLPEPEPEPIAEPSTPAEVVEPPEALDPPASPVQVVGLFDVSTDSTLVQNNTEDIPTAEQSTTEAVDAVIADGIPEEEIEERDLVLVGSQSESDEFALAVDALLESGLDCGCQSAWS